MGAQGILLAVLVMLLCHFPGPSCAALSVGGRLKATASGELNKRRGVEAMLRGGGFFGLKMSGWSESSDSNDEEESEECDDGGDDEDEVDEDATEEEEEDEEEEENRGKFRIQALGSQSATRIAKLLEKIAVHLLFLLVLLKILSSVGFSGWSKVIGVALVILRLISRPSIAPKPKGNKANDKAVSSVSRLLSHDRRQLSFQRLNEKYDCDLRALERAEKADSRAHPTTPAAWMMGSGLFGLAHQFSSPLPESKSSSSTSVSSSLSSSSTEERIFVIEMGDDVAAILPFITDAVNFLTLCARPELDEVVLVLTSPGGSVTDYGLAAEQIARLRRKGLRLTCCVDTIAASGGYMIAAVSSKLLCAPFAMVGSIGVIAMALNAHRAIRKRGIDFVTITAGKYKAPISLLGKIDSDSLDKQQEIVDGIHSAFKQHVRYWRPWIDVDRVGDGSIYLGVHSKPLGLVDGLCTSEEYLQLRMKDASVILVTRYDGRTSTLLGFLKRIIYPQAAASKQIYSGVSEALSSVARTLTAKSSFLAL